MFHFASVETFCLPSIKTAMLLMLFFIMGKQAEKKLVDDGNEADEFEAEVFCKSQNRLIRMEESDEIMVADALEGSSVLLQCKYCEEKDSGVPRTWSRQKHIFTGNITEIEPNVDGRDENSSLIITKDHSLVLRGLRDSDVGLYFCKAPFVNSPKKSFNYLIDLITIHSDGVKGTIKDFKNYARFYIGEINKIMSSPTFLDTNTTDIKVFTEWSDWSECDSSCGKEGVRYRIGKCRVKFFFDPRDKSLEDSSNYFNFDNLIFNDEYNTEAPMAHVAEPRYLAQNIKNWGLALSCKSLLLQKLNSDIYNLTVRIPDFVLSDNCIEPSKAESHKKGPRYRKSIILATGAHLTLVCPDSTIDSEVRWEHNQVRLKPNEGMYFIPHTDEPLLYVDSFNTLYLFQVTEKQSGNYTCFVDGLRMQEVNIIVLTRSLFFTKEFTKHLKCLGYVFVLCFFVYLLGILIICIKSRSEEKKKKICKDRKKLLKNNKNEESDLSP